MYRVESTAEQYQVVENYFNQLLEHGNIMSDVQVEQVNLLETKWLNIYHNYGASERHFLSPTLSNGA